MVEEEIETTILNSKFWSESGAGRPTNPTSIQTRIGPKTNILWHYFQCLDIFQRSQAYGWDAIIAWLRFQGKHEFCQKIVIGRSVHAPDRLILLGKKAQNKHTTGDSVDIKGNGFGNFVLCYYGYDYNDYNDFND